MGRSFHELTHVASRNLRPGVSAILAALLLFSNQVGASVVASWDWNDGTTQGWTASTTASNVNGQFQGTNSGNGSLQFFSPIITVDLTGILTVSFDLTITAFSTVASPSDLTFATLDVLPPEPGPGAGLIMWDLDLSNLAFGELRTFTLSMDIDSSIFNPTLFPNSEFFFGFLFARDFESNASSGLLDNFLASVATPVPEPGTLALLSIGLAVLGIMRRRATSPKPH